MMKRSLHTQAGIALPITLVILLVMLISSIYLLKSSNTTTLTASNLAYDSAQSRAVDFGLHEAYRWLETTSVGNKARLDLPSPEDGYSANYDPNQKVRTPAFWGTSRIVTVGNQRVEYVIHRMCVLPGAYNDPINHCVQTSDNPLASGAPLAVGASNAVSTPRYAEVPRVHYLITARMDGARGGNVVNQLVVLIGG